MKAFDALTPLALLVLVGSQAWLRMGRPLPGQPSYYTIAAGLLVLLHVLLRFEDIARAIGRRQMKYGANTLVASLAVLGLLVAGNYMVVRNTKRWDLTQNQRYSLSDQTKKVLLGLKEDVRVTYFQRSGETGPGQDRMKEYQSASDRIKVEFVDPIKNPVKAQTLDVRGPWPILVVERGDKREKLSNDSEQDVTNALIKVTREGSKTVCFAEGEGERSPDDTGPQGFSTAKGALTKSQYEAKSVVLLREKTVPADCTVLIVAGPTKDLLPEAVEAVRSYVKRGGKALVALDPELKEPLPNLDALLREWNIEPGKDIVVDVSGMGQLFGAGEFTPLATKYPYHDITKDFRLMTLFHLARSMQAGTASVEGVSAQGLIETSPDSWAESDVGAQGKMAYDEGKDRRGPITLAATATVRGPEPTPSPSPSPADAAPAASPAPSPSPSDEPAPRPEGRVAAFGDSDFASNQLLGFQGNQDLFLNVVAWLAEDVDLISVRPREPEDQRLFVTSTQRENVRWLALVVLPGAFVVFGIAAWWRRRG
jgi:ABC-type uncharacterized transport system involved in gliding motility auxiliary subunit